MKPEQGRTLLESESLSEHEVCRSSWPLDCFDLNCARRSGRAIFSRSWRGAPVQPMRGRVGRSEVQSEYGTAQVPYRVRFCRSMKATLADTQELLLPFEPAGSATYEITLGRLLTWRSQLGLGIIGHSAPRRHGRAGNRLKWTCMPSKTLWILPLLVVSPATFSLDAERKRSRGATRACRAKGGRYRAPDRPCWLPLTR